MSIIASAPCKTILFGEHVVVHGKTALATSLNLRTSVALSEIDGANIHITILHLPPVEIALEDLRQAVQRAEYQHGSIDYSVQNITPGLQMELEKLFSSADAGLFHNAYLCILGLTVLISKHQFRPFSLVVTTEIPVGVGLGSSAAFNTALSAALIRFFDPSLVLTEEVPDGLEKINSYAFCAEKLMHGNPSGIDNSAATYGGMIAYTGGQIDHISTVPPLRLLVTNTKVSRNTKLLVQGVRDRCNNFSSVMTPLMDSVHQISNSVVSLFRMYNVADPNAVSQLQDIEKQLEVLFDVNHAILNALGVGHPSLSRIIEISNAHSLHSKLTGAGGGGCAITLIPSTIPDVEELRSSLLKEGFDVFDVIIGGPGVRILD